MVRGSVVTPLSGNLSIVPPFPVRRFKVDEYHRMVQAGVLTEDDPVELLEGWVVPKMPRSPSHDVAVDQTHEQIRDRLSAGSGAQAAYRQRADYRTNESVPLQISAQVLGQIAVRQLLS